MQVPRNTWFREALPEIEVTSDIDQALEGLDPTRLVVLCGAGVSVDGIAGLPTAAQFLKAVMDVVLPRVAVEHGILANGPDPRFELVLGVLRETVDPELAVLGAFAGGEPNHSHKCLAELAQRGSVVLTTNFDNLIERTAGTERPLASACTREDFEDTEDTAPRVWHLHGLLHDAHSGESKSESIIASVSDCWKTKHWFRADASKGRFVRQLLEERDLLVLGYSGADDFDIAPMLEEVCSERRVVWVKQAVFDPGTEPPPLVIKQVFEGDSWYAQPSLNSMANMVHEKNRERDRCLLLQNRTSHVLQRLTGLLDPEDPIGGRADRQPEGGILGASDEQLESMVFAMASKHTAEVLLQAKVNDWGTNFVTNEATRYRFTLRLLKAMGMQSARRFLSDHFAMNVVGDDDLGSGVSIEVRMAQLNYHRALNDIPMENQVLGELGSFAASELEKETIGAAGLALDRGLDEFVKGYPTRELAKAEEYARQAIEQGVEEQNPGLTARARLLLARIAERLEHDAEAVADLFVDAIEDAVASGELAIYAETHGELGMFMSESLGVDFFDLERLSEVERSVVRSVADKAIGPLAKAYRAHAAQGDLHSFAITAGRLGESLSQFPQYRPRALRAHCEAFLYFGHLQGNDGGAQASQWVHRLLDEFESVPFDRRPRSEDEIRRVLVWLDGLPDSQI